MKTVQYSSGSAQQRGATLLEVLIAVLVLSVGLLGVAALQASALRNSQSSYERSQASILTYSLFDAMRADMANVASYNTGGQLCAPPAGASLRDTQLSDWMGNLKANLGNTVTTCVSIAGCGAAPVANCVVTIEWNDSRGTGGDPTESITTETRL